MTDSIILGRMRSRQRRSKCNLLTALYGDRCYYCTRTFERTGRRQRTIDHLVPLCRGGTHQLSNLRLTCQRCNNAKGDMTWWEYIQTPVYQQRLTGVLYEKGHPPKIRPKIEVVTSLEVVAA